MTPTITEQTDYSRWPGALRGCGWLALCMMLCSALTGVTPPKSATRPAPTPTSGNAAASKRLIALTFDDGPRPYVLLGTKDRAGVSSPSLLGLLDREGVKATFFVMGWRLADSADHSCRQVNVGINCRQAAEEEHRRGHEIENHTYGHGDFRRMSKRYGEAWILSDIDKASRTIQSVTGKKPEYVRPPDWDIWQDLQERIESRGYHVMSKYVGHAPDALAWQDVDSQDYLYWHPSSAKLIDPSLPVISKSRRRSQSHPT